MSFRRSWVRAEPAQFGAIEELVKRLDADAPGARDLRIVRLSGPIASQKDVIARAQALYAERTKGLPADQAGIVTAELDERSGSVLLSGSAPGMRLFDGILQTLQQIVAPARTTRVVDVQNAAAKDLLPQLESLIASADSIDAARKIEPPVLRVLEATNSLVVVAEEAQHALVQDLVQRLDRADRKDLPPLKLLQLRASNADAIAQMLTQQYGQRPQADRAQRPVEVRADAATNTLIVSAHPELFEQIRALVDELNKDKKEGQRVTRFVQLKSARAVDVSQAMERLYPQPPIPVDRQGGPCPGRQPPKERRPSRPEATATR